MPWEEEGGGYKGHEETLGMMAVFIIVNIVMVSWVYIKVKLIQLHDLCEVW